MNNSKVSLVLNLLIHEKKLLFYLYYAPAEWFIKGHEIWIDLGSVKNLAQVFVNGKSMGVVWMTPFRVNLTTSLKEGENTLEVKVTNLWVNRLIR